MSLIEGTPFRWQERGSRVRCTVCGRRGWYGYGGARRWWGAACLRGHPWQCCLCGARFASLQAMTSHVRAARRWGIVVGRSYPRHKVPVVEKRVEHRLP